MKAQLGLAALMIVAGATFAAAENESESRVKTTDATGTTVTTEKSHKDSVGLFGTRTVKDESRIVRDPEGLNNKVEQTSEVKQQVQKDGDRSTEVSTVDAAGTERTTTSSVSTSRNIGGGHTKVAKETSVVDPRGMLNRHKVVSEKEEKVNADGTSTTYKEKVDGRTVVERSETNP